MSTAATVIQRLDTYELDSRLYGVLTIASRLAASVKSRTNVLHLAYGFHKTNRSLDEMFDKIQKAADEVATGTISQDANSEPVTPQRLRQVSDNLTHLHQTLAYVIEATRRAGLFNNSLTANSLRRMKELSERLLDLADWCEVAAETEHVNIAFERAHEEKMRGDIFNLDQVE